MGDTFRLIVRRLLAGLAFLVLAPAVAQDASAPAPRMTARQADDAALSYVNREIVVLRAEVAGMTPRERVLDARARLADLDPGAPALPVSTARIVLDGQDAVVLAAGGTPVFALVRADLDPLAALDLGAGAGKAARRLEAALTAARLQREPEVLLRATLQSLAATLALALALAGIRRLRRRGMHWLERAADMPLGWLARRGPDLHAAALAAGRRAARLAALLLGLGACYLWLAFVLRRFPYTEPWGDALAAQLWRRLARLGAAMVTALPGLFTVFLILVLAWLAARALRLLFRAVEEERLTLPFVYADTARPTSWLVTAVIWLFALATAYPYIPGADTPAFQGISVIAGLMATLGSAGVVNQAMSGLILLYARAVAKGEMVSIGGTEGIVSAVGLLSTKLANYRNEEVTLPNTVVLASEIRNYARLGRQGGATVSTTVAVGYDQPWRQVAAMLREAARQTEGVRQDLPARVLQRELSAFHVSYEVVAPIAQPERRAAILDALLASIQDQFNRYGVQIMTPHFQAQPGGRVVVPPERWYAAPAAAPQAERPGRTTARRPDGSVEHR